MIANIDQLPLGSSDDDDNDDYNDYDQIIMHDLSSQANDNQFPEIVPPPPLTQSLLNKISTATVNSDSINNIAANDSKSSTLRKIPPPVPNRTITPGTYYRFAAQQQTQPQRESSEHASGQSQTNFALPATLKRRSVTDIAAFTKVDNINNINNDDDDNNKSPSNTTLLNNNNPRRNSHKRRLQRLSTSINNQRKDIKPSPQQQRRPSSIAININNSNNNKLRRKSIQAAAEQFRRLRPLPLNAQLDRNSIAMLSGLSAYRQPSFTELPLAVVGGNGVQSGGWQSGYIPMSQLYSGPTALAVNKSSGANNGSHLPPPLPADRPSSRQSAISKQDVKCFIKGSVAVTGDDDDEETSSCCSLDAVYSPRQNSLATIDGESTQQQNTHTAKQLLLLNNSKQQQLRRSSLMLTERPRLNDGISTRVDVDLADLLDGTRRIEGISDRYRIIACVSATDFCFILDATAAAAAAITTTDAPGDRRLRADNNSSSSSVFIKMINRHSDEYKSIGRLVNPHHTELAMLQSGQAKHLPQFVEHFWDPDYLVIVTRKHGLPRPRNRLREWLGHLWRFLVSSNSESNDIATSKANAKKTCAATTNALYGAATPSDPRYYPVEWIYYFSHIA